jgi:hypothetical protein
MQIHIQTKDGHSITIKFDAEGITFDKETLAPEVEQTREVIAETMPELIEPPARLDELPERPEDAWPWIFPTRDQTWYRLKEQDYRDFVRSYGRELVEKELKVIIAWGNANYAKRKSMRGMMRFINSWLSRAYAQAPTAKPSLTNAPQSTATSW